MPRPFRHHSIYEVECLCGKTRQFDTRPVNLEWRCPKCDRAQAVIMPPKTPTPEEELPYDAPSRRTA